MKNQRLILEQLDFQLEQWQFVAKIYKRPKYGWVKTIRVALCMTIQQLANRLGVSRARINQLELAEINDAISLRTLKTAANALECELVYALVPKGNSSLQKIIEDRALLIAKEEVSRVAHSMDLEAQSLDSKTIKNSESKLFNRLIDHVNKKLWADTQTPKKNKKKK